MLHLQVCVVASRYTLYTNSMHAACSRVYVTRQTVMYCNMSYDGTKYQSAPGSLMAINL